MMKVEVEMEVDGSVPGSGFGRKWAVGIACVGQEKCGVKDGANVG